MGIRDKTFFDRQLLLETNPADYTVSGSSLSTIVKNVFSDLSGNFYSLEEIQAESIPLTFNKGGYAVRKSTDSGKTWNTVRKVLLDVSTFVSSSSDYFYVIGGDCDSSGSLYVAYKMRVFNSNSRGNVIVDRSTDAGSNWTTVLNNNLLSFNLTCSTTSAEARKSFDISRFSSNGDDIAFVPGSSTGILGSIMFFYSRNKGQTWLSATMNNTLINELNYGALPSVRFYNNSYYLAGFKVGLSPQLAVIVTGSVSGSGAYFTASSLFSEPFGFTNNTFGNHIVSSLETSPVDNKIYALEFSNSGGGQANFVALLSSSDGINFSKIKSTSFQGDNINSLLSLNVFRQPIFTYFTASTYYSDYVVNNSASAWSVNEFAYLAPIRSLMSKLGGPFNFSQSFLVEQGTNSSKVYLLSVNANSSSLGPTSLATSFSFVPPSDPPGKPSLAWKLNNISEYSHAGGLSQMKNMVLGTTTTGKIGTAEDSIIQIRHIGSVVKVMWPKQDSINTPIKGFGDFSAGERPGKLTNQFQPGDEIDVTEFDHVCLYGYLSKVVSGSLDDVVITVERKPLTSAAYTIEQSVDYSVSGSIAEARLRNLEYRKEIDYGDLSIRNIGFPIDIPLVNTKMLRVSVKHRNGQATDANKNFILWGRFIKSSKDTNET